MNLLPPDEHFGATGAQIREAKITDDSIANTPSAAAEISAGLPDSGGRVKQPEMGVRYIQSGSSCVPNSTCVTLSVFDYLDSDRTKWFIYNADRLYREMGGTGSNGVSTEGTLQRVRDAGVKQIDGQRIARIARYAFANQVPGGWRQEVAAGILANGSVDIATLLPSGFGTDNHGPLTSAYHQMAAVWFDGLSDEGRVWFENTWGSGRWEWMTWRELESNDFQRVNGFRHCYAAMPVDIDDLIPEKVEDPPTRIVEFNAKVRVKKHGKQIKLDLALPNPDLADLRGQPVTILKPFQCFATVGNADNMRVVLLSAQACGFQHKSTVSVALRLRTNLETV